MGGAAVESALSRKVATKVRALTGIACRRALTAHEAAQLDGLRPLEPELTALSVAEQRPARGARRTLSAHTFALLVQHLPRALDGFEAAERLIAVRGIIAILLLIEPELGVCEQPPPRDRGARHCLDHLLSTYATPARRTDRCTIAQWIDTARSDNAAQRQAANKVLGRYGLAVEIDDPSPVGNGSWLYVSNSHRRTEELFVGTLWQRPRRGRAPWSLALLQIAGARQVGVRRFDGQGTRAVALPLDYLPKLSEN